MHGVDGLLGWEWGAGRRGKQRPALANAGAVGTHSPLGLHAQHAVHAVLCCAMLCALRCAVHAEHAVHAVHPPCCRLATDIPDMRLRLGFSDSQIFGGTGLSFVTMQLRASF